MEVYFIRHGQSENNAIMEGAGRDKYLNERETDPDLTSIGEQQAGLLGDFLDRPVKEGGFDPQNRGGFGLTHLYCSLMIRAVKTGQTISEKTGLPLVAWPDVHETGGIFDSSVVDGEPVFVGKPGPGKSFYASEFPDLLIPEDLPESGWWDREKEPREKYRERAQRIVDQLVDEHGDTDHRIGIVMHGGIFAHILTALFDIQAENYWFLMNNCGISRVDINQGHAMLAYMNKVDYLPDHYIT